MTPREKGVASPPYEYWRGARRTLKAMDNILPPDAELTESLESLIPIILALVRAVTALEQDIQN